MVSGFCLCSMEVLGEWLKNTAVTRWEYLHLERRNALKHSDGKITRNVINYRLNRLERSLVLRSISTDMNWNVTELFDLCLDSLSSDELFTFKTKCCMFQWISL